MASSSKLPRLPEKPSLALVIEALGLKDHVARTQIDTVLQYVAQNGLKLYLPRGLEFPAQIGLEVEPVDRHGCGEWELLSCGETHHLNTSSSEIQVGHAVLRDAESILVDELVSDGNHYRPVSECQLYVESLPINPAQLFAKREELEAFCERGGETLPSYLDPSSDLYAPELALAIKLHHELLVRGASSYESNLESRVDRWLRVHRQDIQPLSGDLVKRLAKLINPNKKKGNPFYRPKT